MPSSFGCLRSWYLFAVLTAASAWAIPPVELAHAPANGEYAGHADPRHVDKAWRPYHIWNDNCHTAANGFVRAAQPGETRGIVVCQGNPEKDVRFHTANWALLTGGKTCLYNWGRQCCWDSTANPPDVKAGRGLECAKWACGNQWREKETRVLPAGLHVELPGALACVREAGGAADLTGRTMPKDFSPRKRGACMSCCEKREAQWPGEKWDWAKKEEFFKSCREKCFAVFGDNKTKIEHPEYNAAERAGKACYDAASRLKAIFGNGRITQCKACCDKDSNKKFRSGDLANCKATCEKR